MQITKCDGCGVELKAIATINSSCDYGLKAKGITGFRFLVPTFTETMVKFISVEYCFVCTKKAEAPMTRRRY
jgi:hypothetical protein